VPGGRVGAASEDGSYPVQLTMKIGPMQIAYAGRVTVTERNDAARRAVLLIEMKAPHSEDSARATVTMGVAAAGEGSRVELETDVTLRGRAAHLGQGILAEVARRLLDKAAACIETRILGAAT